MSPSLPRMHPGRLTESRTLVPRALMAILILGFAGFARTQEGFLQPGGPPPLAMAVDPTDSETIYVSVPGAIQVSVDSGATWTQAAALPGGDVYLLCVAGEPAVVLAANDRGLFRSADRGGSWTESDAGLPAPPRSVLAAPHTLQVIYALSAGRLFASRDAGASWSASGDGMPPIRIGPLASDPTNPFVAYAAAQENYPISSAREGIYRTADGGATWTQTAFRMQPSSIHFVGALTVDSSDPPILYALSIGCGFGCPFTNLERSLDSGATWSVVSDASPSSNLWVDASTTVYFTNGELSRSRDHGNTWESLTERLPGPLAAFQASPGSPVVLAATLPGNLYASEDSGSTWSLLGQPPGTGRSSPARPVRPRPVPRIVVRPVD